MLILHTAKYGDDELVLIGFSLIMPVWPIDEGRLQQLRQCGKVSYEDLLRRYDYWCAKDFMEFSQREREYQLLAEMARMAAS